MIRKGSDDKFYPVKYVFEIENLDESVLLDSAKSLRTAMGGGPYQSPESIIGDDNYLGIHLQHIPFIHFKKKYGSNIIDDDDRYYYIAILMMKITRSNFIRLVENDVTLPFLMFIPTVKIHTIHGSDDCTKNKKYL